MKLEEVYKKALNRQDLSFDEAVMLYKHVPVWELADLASKIRFIDKPDNIVTWQIDRNVNITNCCISGCKFCNFHCKPHQKERIFITSVDQYREKIDYMLSLGGDQLLLQGGLHPDLDMGYYIELFSELKRLYPNVKLHALGPPEIAHIALISKCSVEQVLKKLIAAGLDSLPGAGAEILVDRVRKAISPAKPSAAEWLEVMRQAHRLNMPTSATMMYGHIETLEERIVHILKIRDLQKECPEGNYGFLAFIAWPYRGKGTKLEAEGVEENLSPIEYLKIVAISRILLNNIKNIQASWLTIGKDCAQVALNSGANDMGSIMIEENVVSSAGASNSFDAQGILKAIKDAGFVPKLRDQLYRFRE